MIIKYTSFLYFALPLFFVALEVAIYFLCKNKSPRFKKIVYLSLMFVNLFQHLFKPLLYPMYAGRGFVIETTAYNMCALLIIVMPFVWLSKGNQALKDFLTYLSVPSGLITMLASPTWFGGAPQSGWELFRFYFCHGLIFLSAVTPLVTGMHKISWKSWYKLAPIFFVFLVVLFVNNVTFCTILGNRDAIWQSNPVGMLKPHPAIPFMEDLIRPFTPKIFMNDQLMAQYGHYVPILWYAIPMYILITVVGFALGALLDKNNFRNDMSALIAKLKKHD